MAWNKATVQKDGGVKYVVAREALTVADSAGANVVTQGSTEITEDIGGRKIPVYIEVTEACAGDGGADVAVQVSFDSVTWTTATTVSLDLDTTDTNKSSGLADLSSIYAPYYRLAVVTDGTDTQDDCSVIVGYAVKIGYGN